MARTVLPIVGAVVGGQVGFIIGSIIGNAIDPQRIKGPKLGDMGVQTSQEGVPRPIVYGTAAVVGNVIDRGTVEVVTTEERQGKGGGPVVETERAYLTFAIRICEGPITGVSRIWEDEKLVYDSRDESTIVNESTKFAAGFNLYLGSETQLPDPELEAIHGVGNTPAYRGTAYIVFVRKDITDRRSISSYRFEVNGGELYDIYDPHWESVTALLHLDDVDAVEGSVLTNLGSSSTEFKLYGYAYIVANGETYYNAISGQQETVSEDFVNGTGLLKTRKISGISSGSNIGGIYTPSYFLVAEENEEATIEFFITIKSLSYDNRFCSNPITQLDIDQSTGYIRADFASTTSPTVMPLGVRKHISIERVFRSPNFYCCIFLGGVKIHDAVMSSSQLNGYFHVFGHSGNGDFYEGSGDEIRVTRGVSRSGGSNFTAPTRLFPSQ